MMIKKLLKFFIGVIDAKLFKSIKFENLKTSNIQDSDEKRSEKKILIFKRWRKILKPR